jgi:CRP-like cAMP-binding protein
MYVTISNPHDENPFPQKLSARTRTLPQARVVSGTHVFREGDRVERIYQVLSGVVRLTRLLEDGRRQIIAFGFPGDIVGFPCDGRHHTDCEPLTPTTLQPYLLSQIESGTGDPELHRGFLTAALREIAAMQDHFMMLGRKLASEKVASFMTVLAARIGTPVGRYTQVDLPMTRADVADFLGLTTETVSRTFSQLRKSRIIAVVDIYTVIILRPEALQALADGDRD